MTKDCQDNVKEIVIPRQEAVFWMDGRGRWHHQHGPFKHKKIIDYFNSAIKKDEGGYFVGQNHGRIYEKVYFPYEETALFAVDVVWEPSARLLLNTGESIPLTPEKLFVRNDHLFCGRGDEIIKFSERALMAISPRLEQAQGGYVLNLMGRKCAIAEG